MRYLIFFIVCWFMVGVNVAHCAVSTILADTNSGLILSSQNASKLQYPASLTKVMTLYLTFNAMENGLLDEDDLLPISHHAAKQPPSKLHLKAGRTIRVRDAIYALIIKSANDAAVVLAEALAPSEADFAKMMTQTAKKLGLKNTVFRNASGLHNPNQVTTAQDMAVLTIAMINHFPEYYKLFSKNEFRYNGKVYKSHNRVTRYYNGAEGLKTGYIAAVGYNIISTAKRDNKRLVTVVIGQKSTAVRDKQAVNLLDKGFNMAQKQPSKLRKLSQQGKKLNTYAALSKPNLYPQLKVMQKRLAQVRVADNKNTLQLAQASEKNTDTIVNHTEMEQGDHGGIQGIDETTLARVDTLSKNNVSIAPEYMTALDFKVYSPTKEDSIEKTVEKSLTASMEAENHSALVGENPQTETITKTAENETRAISEQKIAVVAAEKSEMSPQAISTWGVQVGAFYNKEAAQNQADKAFKFIREHNRFIKITENEQMYRSRIYGFKNKKAAASACRTLKRKKIGCLPLSPTLKI